MEGEEDEPESPDYSPKDEEEEASPPRHALRRPTRTSNRSPEPGLVMPSLDTSWAGSSSRSTRPTRSAEKDARRRNSARRGTNDQGPVRALGTKAGDSKLFTAGPGSKHTPSTKGSSDPFQDSLDIVIQHGAIMASWTRDVVGGAFRVMKTPISYFLAIWLLFGLLIILRTLVTNSVYASLSPACRIPGASLLNLPFCPVHQVDTSNGPPPPVEFDQLMQVQAQFEEVLEESAGGVSLPMDMKRGEASIRDLRQLVRYSQLQSK